jgi:hypothetical protein
VQTGTKHLLKAVECDPCNPVVLENLAGLGVDPVQAFAEHPDPELRVLLNPKDAQAWQTLIQNALDRGLLSSAKVLKRLSLRSLSASPPASQARATEHRISSPRPG